MKFSAHGFFFACLATSSVFSATPIDGEYMSGFGGFTYVPGNINVTQGTLTRSNTSYQSGFDAGGNLGFKSNLMRYEGEVTYLSVNVNQFNVNGTQQVNPSGYNRAVLGMANVYYDWPGCTTLQPFLGAGIGYAWVQAKLDSTGPAGITNYNGTNSVFAYQATGGLTYNFSENYALNIGYRYVATTHAPAFGHNVQAHLANLGAVYRFNGDFYK